MDEVLCTPFAGGLGVILSLTSMGSAGHFDKMYAEPTFSTTLAPMSVSDTVRGVSQSDKGSAFKRRQGTKPRRDKNRVRDANRV